MNSPGHGWCLNAGDGYPGIGPVPLVTGNLTIHE